MPDLYFSFCISIGKIYKIHYFIYKNRMNFLTNVLQMIEYSSMGSLDLNSRKVLLRSLTICANVI